MANSRTTDSFVQHVREWISKYDQTLIHTIGGPQCIRLCTVIIMLIPLHPQFEEEEREQRPPWLYKHTVSGELSFECVWWREAHAKSSERLRSGDETSSEVTWKNWNERACVCACEMRAYASGGGAAERSKKKGGHAKKGNISMRWICGERHTQASKRAFVFTVRV